MLCYAMICDAMPWVAKLCYDMLCHVFKNALVSEMLCFQKCHGFINAMFSIRPCYGKCWVCYDIVTSWGMFTDVKPHDKMRQVRCRTNLPRKRRIHVILLLTSRWCVRVCCNSQNCWGLTNLSFVWRLRLLVRTLWAHMLRQDNKDWVYNKT